MSQDGDDFADEAGTLLDDGRFEAALAVSRRGLLHFPDDPELRFLEATALRELGHYPIARELLEKLKEDALFATDPDFLSELTCVYLNLGKKKAALDCAKAILRLPDPGRDSLLWLSGLLHDHNADAEAALCAARAIKLAPGDSGGWRALALATFSLGRLPAAGYCCGRALKNDPEDIFTLDLLGAVHFDSSRPEDAKAAWGRIPIDRHFDPATLVAWRSLLGSSDPKAKEIRERWSALRKLDESEDPIRAIRRKGSL